MTWQWGKCEYRATFERTPHDPNDFQAHRRERATFCTVERRDGDVWMRVTSARATCSHEDQFVKETGRKIALTRALAAASALEVPLGGFVDGKDAPEGYEDRREFRRRAWEAYRWRKGQKVLDRIDKYIDPLQYPIPRRAIPDDLGKCACGQWHLRPERCTEHPPRPDAGFCPECGDVNPCETRTGCAGEARRAAE